MTSTCLSSTPKRSPGAGLDPVQIGYKPRYPTLANITQRSRSSLATSTAKAQAGVLPAALHQQTQPGPKHNMPSPGRQISGMASYENCCGWVGMPHESQRARSSMIPPSR
jgi:hypothetical protein